MISQDFVTYVTDCYAKFGPTIFLIQLSLTNFICWSNKKLDEQLATLRRRGLSEIPETKYSAKSVDMHIYAYINNRVHCK